MTENEINWISNLKKEYNYCGNIDILPFPSASPQFFTGYKIQCKLDGQDIIDKKICDLCEKQVRTNG